MKLIITRNNSIQEERLLSQGVYLLGRGASCTIRLNNQSISREHCRLEVQAGKVNIKDLGSTNGIGYCGKQIIKRQLKPPFTLDIGEYQLKFNDSDTLPAPPHASLLGRTLARCPILLLTTCLVAITILAFWAGRSPLVGQIEQANHKSATNQAVRIAQTIAEMNRTRWFSGDMDGLTVSPFSGAKGVINALLLDQYGTLLNQDERHTEIQDSPLLAVAISSGNSTIDAASDGQITVFYPLKQQDFVKGVVCVIYRETAPFILITEANLESLLLFLAVLFLAMLLIPLIRKVWQYPLQELTAATSMALRENMDHLATEKTAVRLTEMKLLIERLLLKASKTRQQGKSSFSKQDSLFSQTPVEEFSSNQISNQEKRTPTLSLPDELPACIINLHTSCIQESSPHFIALFNGTPTPGSHLLECIQEPAILEHLNGKVNHTVMIQDGETWNIRSTFDPEGSFILLCMDKLAEQPTGDKNE